MWIKKIKLWLVPYILIYNSVVYSSKKKQRAPMNIENGRKMYMFSIILITFVHISYTIAQEKESTKHPISWISLIAKER